MIFPAKHFVVGQDKMDTAIRLSLIHIYHMIVVPGRKSIEKAKEYYNRISEEYENADFYPLSYDKMDERIRKLVDLAETSDYNYVIKMCIRDRFKYV